MGMKKNINIQTGIRIALFSLLAILGAQPFSYSNPEDGEVVIGEVQIIQESPSRLNIVQSTDKAIINWQGFSIGQGEHTDFQQPSSDAITLNRVLGSDPSEILGRLTANGRVVLVNPNGIFFEKGSTVDVSALIASTQDISNTDFMSGKLSFNSPLKPASQIINKGTINIKNSGLAALVAPSIQNSGAIMARLGKVTLASGDSVTIDLYGDDRILFGLRNEAGITSGASSTMSALIENSGRIQADGGWVLLSVDDAKDIVDQAINMAGVIQTRTAELQDGQIILKAGNEGVLTVSGTLDASAPYGGNGGFIETSAGYVDINPNAVISTYSTYGNTGAWLIDPVDYTVATGGDITGTALGSYLNQNNVEIRTSATGLGNGDIYVNSPVSWSSSNSLTLSAHRNINIYGAITNNGGGSLSLRSDYDADGTGTVSFGMGGSVTMSGEGIASIFYNPSLGYTSPTDYSSYFTGTEPVAYMLVHSLEDLQAINENLEGSYALSKNIDASATSTWNNGAGFVPLGSSDDPFTGNFYGNGFTISDLTINRLSTWEVGLFGYLDYPTVISHVGLVRPVISGNRTVGGLAGYNGGIISNVSITDGHISGINGWIGGLVGINWAGEIYDSYSIAEVSSTVYGDEIGGFAGSNSGGIIERAYSAGSVSGGNHIGGLVGHNSGDITDAYSTSSVSGYENIGGLIGEFHGGTLNRSYSTGAVSGTSEVGGLIGFIEDGVDDGSIVSSYWDTQTSGQTTSADGTGLTTTQMKTQASLSGWDFTNIWSIAANEYPLLRTAGHQVITNPDVPLLPDDNPNDPNNPNNPNDPPPYIPPSYASIPVSWFMGANHYDSWDDYLNNNPWFITGLSWSESAHHYSSWEEYLKTSPFITTVTMNKSIQLDSQGRFKDGMLNPLGYLTTIGGGGLGFANLEDGGSYKGFSETGSAYETQLEWIKSALRMAEEVKKQETKYDPAVAKIWEDAAMARLDTLKRRVGSGETGSGEYASQGGSGDSGQGTIEGGSDTDKIIRRSISDLEKAIEPDIRRRYISDNSLTDMEILKERSNALQKLIDQGEINPDFVVTDRFGNLNLMDENSMEIQKAINNGVLFGAYLYRDYETGQWEELRVSDRRKLDDWYVSQELQKRIEEGTLNPEFVRKDYKGDLVLLDDETIRIKTGLMNGTIDPEDVIKEYNDGLRMANRLADELKNLNEEEQNKKVIDVFNKNPLFASDLYDDYNDSLGSLTSSQLSDILTDKNLSDKGRDALNYILLSKVNTSKLVEITQDLTTEQIAQVAMVSDINASYDKRMTFLDSLPEERLAEITPLLTINTIDSLDSSTKYAGLFNKIEPNLPGDWKELVSLVSARAYYILDLGMEKKEWFLPDGPIGSSTGIHQGQNHGITQPSQQVETPEQAQ